MNRRGFALGLLAAGCNASSGFRDLSRPIGVTTRFDAARFGGDWVVVDALGTAPGPKMRFDPASGVLEDQSATPPVAYEINTRSGLAVMWVDEGFRTAALGSPDGRIGFVMDRTAPGAPDRRAAAREVMAFNGWRTDLLRPLA